MTTVPPEVTVARAERWWRNRRPVTTLRRASAFVDDVGFALLFPSRGVSLPSLYETVTDLPVDEAGHEWGPDIERVWGWKDELPLKGLAWYGRFLRGRPSFVSPLLLRDLYPRTGEPDDFATDPSLSADGRRIAEIVLLSGPTSTATLREALDAFGPKGRTRFSKALTELGKALVLTNFGTEDQQAGWPAAVLELTARAFDLGADAGRDPTAGRREAARRFLDTMVQARPHELGNAFGWGAAAAREALEHLVERGEAVRRDPAYRLVPSGSAVQPRATGRAGSRPHSSQDAS